jgi:hypothetical protein
MTTLGSNQKEHYSALISNLIISFQKMYPPTSECHKHYVLVYWGYGTPKMHKLEMMCEV